MDFSTARSLAQARRGNALAEGCREEWCKRALERMAEHYDFRERRAELNSVRDRKTSEETSGQWHSVVGRRILRDLKEEALPRVHAYGHVVPADAAPVYWMDETGSALRPAVDAYLGGGEMTSTELMALQAYLKRSIAATNWGGERVEDLRARVDNLDTREKLKEWLCDALDLGIDPYDPARLRRGGPRNTVERRRAASPSPLDQRARAFLAALLEERSKNERRRKKAAREPHPISYKGLFSSSHDKGGHLVQGRVEAHIFRDTQPGKLQHFLEESPTPRRRLSVRGRDAGPHVMKRSVRRTERPLARVRCSHRM